MPTSDLSWPLAIVMAAADVNPAVTGIEMNCTRKPASAVGNKYWSCRRCIMNEAASTSGLLVRTEVQQPEEENNESGQKR